MAIPTKPQDTQTKAQGTPTSATPEQAISAPHSGVIVMGKKKKKKKRYSRGLRTVQELEVASTKTVKRLTKALNKGLGAWDSARDKSAKKKRNGAVKDSLKNSSKGMRKLFVQSAHAPSDFLDEFSRMKIVKNLFN